MASRDAEVRGVPRLSRMAIFGVPALNAPQFAATEAAVRAIGELATAKRLPLFSLFGEFPKAGVFHSLRAELTRFVAKMRGLCCQNSAWCQAE
jgi:hypothetical protein